MTLFQHLNFEGLLVGLGTFAIIGIFHPLVIKGYYYFGLKCRVWFGVLGVLASAASLFVDNSLVAILLGVLGFSSFWSIGEVTHQAERVRKGWFPANPAHTRTSNVDPKTTNNDD